MDVWLFDLKDLLERLIFGVILNGDILLKDCPSFKDYFSELWNELKFKFVHSSCFSELIKTKSKLKFSSHWQVLFHLNCSMSCIFENIVLATHVQVGESTFKKYALAMLEEFQ